MTKDRKTIRVGVSLEEYASFKAEAERIGLRLSAWMRLVSRKSSGMMDKDRP